MKPDLRIRKPALKQDYADRAARQALRDFKVGSQISGGCAELYEAVASAIREQVLQQR